MARPVGRSVGDRTIMTVQNCEGVVSEQRHDLGCRLRRVKTSGSGARAAEPGSTDLTRSTAAAKDRVIAVG